jgi:hypothetical protein
MMIKKSKLIVATRNNDLRVEICFKNTATDVQIAKWLVHFSKLIDCKKCGKPILQFASRDRMCWKCFSKVKKK